jgi:DnaA regulatory inactivator Hda
MSGGGAQLPLDLRHRTAMGREDFLVSPSNAEAVKWIDLWPNWPSPALVLVGPPGSGKTHLAQVWRARTGAAVLAHGGAPEPAAEASAVVVDDADGRDDDEGLFHLYNALASSHGHVLFTSAVPPARWAGRLRDLVSRLSAAPTVRIQAPDEPLIAAVMAKMFADRQLSVAPEVLAFLVARMERSFGEARALVAALDAASLSAKRAVTLPLARDVLAARGQEI